MKTEFIYSDVVYANFSTLEKVKLFSTFVSTTIGKMLNHKLQFWRVNISTNETLIFSAMLSAREDSFATEVSLNIKVFFKEDHSDY